ncbi:amino acid/polyamine transporter I [Trichophaea hybrida]|nr:amino acid/polyamine transporter I [Trichophaea hybrida]
MSPHTPTSPAIEGSSEAIELQRTGGQSQSSTNSNFNPNSAPKKLGFFDVVALVLNRQIGTGIFISPVLTLVYCRSKQIALIIWAAGGVYTMICFAIYVEYGLSLQYNGGELVYLDEIWWRPSLLSVTVFAFFFITLGTSSGNAFAFSKHILLAYSGYDTIQTPYNIPESLVKFVAIVVVTIICLILYFSNNFGLYINKAFAIYKILLLVTLIIGGFVVAIREGFPGLRDYDEKELGHQQIALAMVTVLWAYQGWENANYVGWY